MHLGGRIAVICSAAPFCSGKENGIRLDFYCAALYDYRNGYANLAGLSGAPMRRGFLTGKGRIFREKYV